MLLEMVSVSASAFQRTGLQPGIRTSTEAGRRELPGADQGQVVQVAPCRVKTTFPEAGPWPCPEELPQHLQGRVALPAWPSPFHKCCVWNSVSTQDCAHRNRANCLRHSTRLPGTHQTSFALRKAQQSGEKTFVPGLVTKKTHILSLPCL